MPEKEVPGMLKINGISKTFNPGTVNEKVALNNLSLHLKAGDFVTIIGSNGAGKSTLFNAICGDFITDRGSILLDGQDITFAPGMSIDENLVLAAGHGGWFSRISSADKKRFREELSLLGMGLEDRMKQPVGLLSGGQRQALTLLMATIDPPKLLLLDEHTAALDPGTAKKVLQITDDVIKSNNITTLMVTHNMQNALEMGNRTIMMDSGRIVLDLNEDEKKGLTVKDLIEKFKEGAGKEMDNDRILLS